MNIFTTQTPAFKKQSLTEFFLKPMFLGNDIRSQVTVRTGVKGTELLNHISAPSMITRKKTNPGFTPRGAFQLTTQEITVSPMAIEFEQNAREFWDSVIQELLASGYKEDDIEKMPESDLWNKIILPMIARAGKQDLIRQMWFGDTEIDIPADVDSDVEDWEGYDGFFKNIHESISENNNLSFGVDKLGEGVEIVINDITDFSSNSFDVLVKVYDADNSYFDYNFLLEDNHGPTVSDYAQALFDTINNSVHNGVHLTSWAVISMDKKNDKWTITIKPKVGNNARIVYLAENSNTTASVNVSFNVIEATVKHFEPDEVDDAMNTILNNAIPELLEFTPVFYLSYATWRNLFQTWKNLGTDKANTIRWNGLNVPSYEGHPIIIRHDWDKWDNFLQNYIPGKILFTTPKNLLFATDGALDSEMIETWYNQDEQKRRYRVQYKAATAVLHSELLLGANL